MTDHIPDAGKMVAPTWERDGVRLYLGDCLDAIVELA